ncbi:MAG: IclR family transcriptional regulator [Flavobacteriaceae bacterium]|nr:IclR family transcriptional regulator [Flavobacteriaceae bacterium]
MVEDSKGLNMSVVKAFSVLEAFTSERKRWGVRDLAKHIGYNKTTTFRLLRSLEHVGAVHKDVDDKYRLGLKLFQLGHEVSLYKALRSLSQEPLEHIAKEITETIHFGVFEHFKVLYLNKAESPLGLKVSTQIGTYQDAYCSAMGKVLLSHLEDKDLHAYFDRTERIAHTSNTIIEASALRCELNKVNVQGYALDMEELELGLICLAIPVRNPRGKVIAAISASGPSSRFKSDKMDDYLDILRRGAKQLEDKLSDFS